MEQRARERRSAHRYELHLPVHFRISQKGTAARWGAGVLRDMSTGGLSFRTRKPVPVGSHIEVIVDWPARYAETHPVALQVTGFVLRSDSGRTAVRVTSHRFRIDSNLEDYRATA